MPSIACSRDGCATKLTGVLVEQASRLLSSIEYRASSIKKSPALSSGAWLIVESAAHSNSGNGLGRKGSKFGIMLKKFGLIQSFPY
jgi:hypothetical protein